IYDSKIGRVTQGYGILQPRITPTLPSTQNRSLFQDLSTGDAGIDPYASAVSDVYQDLFFEGSFTGKGIYDLKTYEMALSGRIPENSILSHDLFEGNYLRCGFLSDVEFFEDFPSHTEIAINRSHRWIRGDWQLLSWILGRGGNTISILGRWKMIDNLRRSLVAPASFLLILIVLSLADSNLISWIILAFIGISSSSLMNCYIEILRFFKTKSVQQSLSSLFRDFKLGVYRFLLQLTLLPHIAILNLDAIFRTLFRLFVSHKNLLEWTTAAQLQKSVDFSKIYFLTTYLRDLFFVLISLIVVGKYNNHLFAELNELSWISWILFLLWIASPWIAMLASLPQKPKLIMPLQEEDIALLNRSARKIWYFFSTFVTKEDHFLPPDNFQESPSAVVAHRSSPTNFGLYLLSILSARDFGWIGTFETIERLEKSLQSMEKLPRHNGHFFNWYETREFLALEPKYISSVDNGNLAGHLLATAQGCIEILKKPLPIFNFSKGALQTLLIFEEALELVPSNDNIKIHVLDLRKNLLKFNSTSTSKKLIRARIERQADEIHKAMFKKNENHHSFETAEALVWAKNLQHDILSSALDYNKIFSWMDLHAPLETLSFKYTQEWHQIYHRLSLDVPLSKMGDHLIAIHSDVQSARLSWPKEDLELIKDLENFEVQIQKARQDSEFLIQRTHDVIDLCHRLFHEMDFNLLYDSSKSLFSIGYRVSDQQIDNSFYDLMASEARLTSFIAIAKGDVPALHWFKLGRGMTSVNNGNILVSWSGSMFEYLMPSLVMQFPEGSIIDQTCQLSVDRHIEYGKEQEIPWGISESAYNKRDIHLTFQYSSFGVPDLGLKRGLGSDLVVAPYASFLASMYDAFSAVKNLRSLLKLGAEGSFGFYESIDFTKSRLPEGMSHYVVKTYMAHHQGMSLVAINNVLHNGLMQRRFHAHPLVNAAELLLQERMPRDIRIKKSNEKTFYFSQIKEEVETVSRQYNTVNRLVPHTVLLSNGNYSLMLSSTGSGYSKYQDLAISRWREDVTRDNWGTFFYLKDIESNKIGSATYQPTCLEVQEYQVTFFEDRARFRRLEDHIHSALEVFLSPEHTAEIRQLTLMNSDDREREIEITSYFEVVLNTEAADVAHPAFSNLFVQTEFIAELNALVATRRARSSKEQPLWVAHMVTLDRYSTGEIQYETSRLQFIGRGRDLRKPMALFERARLTNSVGSVLDPIMSLRTRVILPAGATSQIRFTTLVAETREALVIQIENFQDQNIYERITSLVWTQSQVNLHYLNMEPDEAHLFQRLATRLLYMDSSLRSSPEIIK
ncbi:MAG TPA: glucoamylase family protein, partial [Pseudobdellovibrionaceae bacterium]|nr:glucoamylase family protein [Pseudobdellovibrionaceae bacterium]